MSARLGDMWAGVCCCKHKKCKGMSGMIITGAGTVFFDSLPVALLTCITIGFCGHPGFICSASGDVIIENLGDARLTDAVCGCNIGVIVTSSFDVLTNNL